MKSTHAIIEYNEYNTFKTTSMASDMNPNHPPFFWAGAAASGAAETAASARVYIRLSALVKTSFKSIE